MSDADVRATGYVRHIPNLITVGRAGLAIPYFVILAASNHYLAMRFAAGLFIGSMVFDVVDGYLARRLGAETVLGRILDPVLDKVVICGSLVFCIAVSRGMLAPWMVVVVLTRELTVSALRGFIESQGTSFKATVTGKVKTASQCFAISAILIYAGMRSEPKWAEITTTALIWTMMTAVVISGVDYIARAARIIVGIGRSSEEGERPAA